MKKQSFFVGVVSALVWALGHGVLIAQPNIPVLDWTERDSWVNVKTEVSPAAVGDGVADDTAALQAALSQFNGTAGGTKVVYVPSGTYNISSTLTWPSSVGCTLIGHGRDTKILWTGTGTNQAMLRTDGAARCNFIGITWDGGNRALGGSGIHHNAKSRFESSNRHQHEAFLNLGRGIFGSLHNGGKYATSEMVIDNCLFSNCDIGLDFASNYNYYNETVTRCEFRQCGVGVKWGAGYGYVRFSHFEGSTVTDIQTSSGYPSSARFCTSNGSAMFYNSGTSEKAIVQNCVIANYTGTYALKAGHASMMFDNQILSVSGTLPPILLQGDAAVVSNNTVSGTGAVYSGTTSYRDVPTGAVQPLSLEAEQSFLQQSLDVPATVFDAKVDFGAVTGNGTDNTVAAQLCIDAARNAGNGAVAYFPTGQYRISSTINVTGSNFVIAGDGYHTEFRWTGSSNGTVFQIIDPQDVRMEYLSLPDHLLPVGTTGIRQVSTGVPSKMAYDRLTLASGPKTYSASRTREGLHLVNLPDNAVVHLGEIVGTVRLEDCGQAVVYGEMMNTSGELIDGAVRPTDGFLGFATRNGINLFIDDNHSFVVGDCNMEQSSVWSEPNVRGVWLSGGDRTGTARTTIGAIKMNIFDSPTIVQMDNYEGNFSYVHGKIANGGHEYQYALHSGSRPLKMLYAANSFDKNNHLLEVAGSAGELMNIRNWHAYYRPSEWYGQGATWVASTVAQPATGLSRALQFDGTDDVVIAPKKNEYGKNLQAMTLMAWVKPDVLGRDSIVCAYKAPETTSNTHFYSLEISASNQARFMVRMSASPFTAYYTPYSAATLPAGQWSFLVGTWDGSNVNIYVNGVLQGTAAAFVAELGGGGGAHMNRLLIGGAAGRYFDGAIDEVRLYNVAFPGAAIAAAYNAGNGVSGNPAEAGLVVGYHFDEGAGRNAYSFNNTWHGLLYQIGVDSNPAGSDLALSGAMDHFRQLGSVGFDLNFPAGEEVEYHLNPVADATVRGGTYANTNYGTSTSLIVKNTGVNSNETQEGFLRFDLASASGTVVEAKLRLYVTASNVTHVHRAFVVPNDTWLETGITYANKPAAGAQIAQWNPTAAGSWVEIPLDLALVQAESSGDKLLSLQIVNNGSGYHHYRSRNYAASKPELVLVVEE